MSELKSKCCNAPVSQLKTEDKPFCIECGHPCEVIQPPTQVETGTPRRNKKVTELLDLVQKVGSRFNYSDAFLELAEFTSGLERELSAAQRRLDFIINGLSFVKHFDGTSTLYHSILGKTIGQGNTPIEAIDAAISQQTERK